MTTPARINRLRGSLATLGIFDAAVESDRSRRDLFEASFSNLDLPIVEYQTIRDICDLGGVAAGPSRTALEAVLISLFAARREGSLCVPLSLEGLRERLSAYHGCDGLISGFLDGVKTGAYRSVLLNPEHEGEAPHAGFLPLVAANGNLYFQRYLAAENLLREALLKRFDSAIEEVVDEAGQLPPSSPSAVEAFGKHVAEVLSKPVRDPVSGKEIKPGSDQKLALALSLLRRGVIITGGPGTGKTSIVFAMLRVLLRAGLPASRIGLAAPTGRAAQRVGESLRQQFDRLPEELRDAAEAAIREIVPATIHRLLGYSPMTLGFRHDRRNPLDLDVVIVDEASMIDVDLMARLLDAIPPAAKVVLLGDADQLPSVEAGAVLADLVGGQRRTRLSAPWLAQARALLGKDADEIDSVSGMSPPATTAAAIPLSRFPDHVIVLRQSFRSVREILDIAETVNTFPEDPIAAAQAGEDLIRRLGAGTAHVALCRDLTGDQEAFARRMTEWVEEFCRVDSGTSSCPVFSYDELVHRYRRSRPESDTPEERRLLEAMFRLIDRRRLLTVFREGPFGSEGINEVISTILRRRLGFTSSGRFFPGAVVMVTRNDYRLELFNGDTGVILPGPRGGLNALFPRHDGFLRVEVDELPAPTLAFAGTVHKSQGSEFDEVTLVVPSSPFGPIEGQSAAPSGSERILTREIIYTGLTRAKKRVTIWTDQTAFFAACRRRVKRTSGL